MIEEFRVIYEYKVVFEGMFIYIIVLYGNFVIFEFFFI